MRFSNVNSVASPPPQVTINSTPPPAIGSSVGNFYAVQNIAPGDTAEGTLTTPNISGIDWMIISRGGVGGSGTIPLTAGYPGNADAAVQDSISVTSIISGVDLGLDKTINQQLYFAPGVFNNNGGQAGLFTVLPFIPNANITLKTTWNTSLTDDLPMDTTALLLVNKPYAYLSSLPSFGITVISESFTAGETLYMVCGSIIYPYDWITVNVNNPNNTSNLTVEIYASSVGYGLGGLLMPSTALGDGNNYFSVRMADGGLTNYIANPQIIVQVTSSVAQSVYITGFAYPDLSKPLLLL